MKKPEDPQDHELADKSWCLKFFRSFPGPPHLLRENCSITSHLSFFFFFSSLLFFLSATSNVSIPWTRPNRLSLASLALFPQNIKHAPSLWCPHYFHPVQKIVPVSGRGSRMYVTAATSMHSAPAVLCHTTLQYLLQHTEG